MMKYDIIQQIECRKASNLNNNVSSCINNVYFKSINHVINMFHNALLKQIGCLYFTFMMFYHKQSSILLLYKLLLLN